MMKITEISTPEFTDRLYFNETGLKKKEKKSYNFNEKQTLKITINMLHSIILPTL